MGDDLDEMTDDAVYGLWDESEPVLPSEETLKLAKRVLKLLGTTLFPSRVVEDSEGGIVIGFEKGENKYADFECCDDGELLAAMSNRVDEPIVWTIDTSSDRHILKAITLVAEFLEGGEGE